MRQFRISASKWLGLLAALVLAVLAGQGLRAADWAHPGNLDFDDTVRGDAYLMENDAYPTGPDAYLVGPDVLPQGMTALDASSVLVTDYASMKKALEEDNGYTRVYLGADITASAAGITIHPSKFDVIIDGANPDGGVYTFTQYNASGEGYTIRPASAAVSLITLRNLNVVGYNQFGVIYIPPGYTDIVDLVHDGVTYHGPQAVHHRSGLTHLINSRYTITSGELAETRYLELGGQVEITSPTSSNSIFWLTAADSFFTLLPQAQVTVTDGYYLLFTDGYQPKVLLSQGASLSLSPRRFGLTYAGQSVRSIVLEQDSALHLDLNTPESYAALRVSELFQMAPGSHTSVVRTGTAGIALRLTQAGARVVFDHPDRVFLYSSAGVPLRFTGAGTLSVTTSALNLWRDTTWPLPQGLAMPPTYVWNKAEAGLLTFTGAYNEATLRTLTHNLEPDDPVTDPLTASTFQLERAKLLAFGETVLSLDPPSAGALSVQGWAGGDAYISVSYPGADGAQKTAVAQAGRDGRYQLTLDEPLAWTGTVSALALHRDLAMRQTEEAQPPANGGLSLSAVPQTLAFGSHPLSELDGRIWFPDALTSLSVSDQRPEVGAWRLAVTLDEPLTAEIGGQSHAVPGALVFVDTDDAVHVLDETPLTIYTHTPSATRDITLYWPVNTGVGLRLVPGSVYSGADYSATLTWTLVDAP